MRLRGSDPRQGRTKGGCTQSGHQFASVKPDNSVCHNADADHFPLDMSSRRSYVPGSSEMAIFLLRTSWLML